MKSVGIRGSVVAAVASIFILNAGMTAPAFAQQRASAANPELAAKGEWDETVTYALDDIVTARGSAWISLRANNRNRVPGQTQPSTSAYWQLFARGFNPTGAWSNATKYQPDDLVTRGGQTWRAKRTVQASPTPPAAGANWELFAAKGAAGPNSGVPDGTSSTPGISFDGDPNTGIYQPEHGKIALVEGGTLFLHNIGTGNTSLGIGALSSLTTGQQNTALGDAALQMTSSGAKNTALGELALRFNINGNENTAVGASALGANANGSLNTAVGYRALPSNLSGNNNTAIGTHVMVDNTSGSFNIAIGSGAASANTTGSNNVSVGLSALATNQTGENNIAIGRNALSYATADDNTAIGHEALYLTTTGSGNAAVGATALRANTTGTFNVALGGMALTANTEGTANAAMGFGALASNTTGNTNVAVGGVALGGNTTGSTNVAIGHQALSGGATGSGNTALGYRAGRFGASASNSIYINNEGDAGDATTIKIGTQGTQTTAFMAGITGVNVANEAAVAINTSTGQLGVVASSRRYKEDIAPMGDVNGVLMKLRPVTFHYKAANDDGRRKLQYGLIAEEVAESVPDLAAFNAQGTPETVKYHLLPSFLLAGYQAQQQTIAVQADEIARLKERVAASEALEARLARLEALLPQAKAAALR